MLCFTTEMEVSYFRNVILLSENYDHGVLRECIL